MRAVVIALAAAAAVWWGLRRLIVVVTVDGDSMLPTFATGDRLLVRRTRLDRLRRGSVVAVMLPPPAPPGGSPAEPRTELMIKRVGALPGDPVPPGVPVTDASVPPRHLVVIGDNPHGSHDSRAVGYVPAEALLGVVIRRMALN